MTQVIKHFRKDGSINWKKTILYVVKRLEDGVMCKTVAAELGVTQKSLASSMTFWRQRGVPLPNMHYTVPDGHMRTRLQKGIRYKEVKIDGVWKQIGRADGQPYKERKDYKAPGGRKKIPDEPKTPTVKKILTPKDLRAKSESKMPSPKEPKKEVPKLPTKVVDPSRIKTIKVSKTTYIQVDIDVPNEVAIERWKKKYEQ